MGREIERDHLALSSHGWIIHNSVVLATITSSSVKKHDFLRALATKLIEYLGLSPYRSIDIDIFASDMIFIDDSVCFLGKGTVNTLADHFKKMRCKVCKLSVFSPISTDLCPALIRIHTMQLGVYQ